MTLVEVLIAVVILGVGLLGVARLQLLSLRGSTGAYMRSQATVLAYDIIDRLRANVQVNADLTDSGDILTVAGNYNTAGYLNTPPTSTDCSSEACSAVQLAGYDLAQWMLLVSDDDVLPDGEGRIACAGDPVICTVSLRWEAPSANPGDQGGKTNDEGDNPYGSLEVSFTL